MTCHNSDILVGRSVDVLKMTFSRFYYCVGAKNLILTGTIINSERNVFFSNKSLCFVALFNVSFSFYQVWILARTTKTTPPAP